MYQHYFQAAVAASHKLSQLSTATIQSVLDQLAQALIVHAEEIIEANTKDLARMDPNDAKYDRLLLDKSRLHVIAEECKKIAGLTSPLGEIISNKTLDNELEISKMRVPLGVIGVIYEARPNVTVDVFALCFKTGNVAVLKGGSDAEYSNIALMKIITAVLNSHDIDQNAAVLLPAERDATAALLNARGLVDVLIPRGSQALIDHVRENSKVPVIETGAGIVHTYFDSSGDALKAREIIFNAKTRRVSVCNALDCLLVHKDRLADLPLIACRLAEKNVKIYADQPAFAVLKTYYPEELLCKAKAEDYGIEFLDYKMSIKTVANIEEALDHIARYSSRHSEAIIAEDIEKQMLFLNAVDAAAVYTNASTAFTDGGQFGMGAEIGISTQKLHARGPMGLEELTSYKWLIRGNGQVR
jgi:glutamate-5-semialdehyde dehydrogenase